MNVKPSYGCPSADCHGAFFADNPDREYRVRLALPCEYAPPGSPIPVGCWTYSAARAVRVLRGIGWLYVVPCFLAANSLPDDGEDFAREIYEGAAQHGYPVKVYQMVGRGGWFLRKDFIPRSDPADCIGRA